MLKRPITQLTSFASDVINLIIVRGTLDQPVQLDQSVLLD
jgi:hypothetical protein